MTIEEKKTVKAPAAKAAGTTKAEVKAEVKTAEEAAATADTAKAASGKTAAVKKAAATKTAAKVEEVKTAVSQKTAEAKKETAPKKTAVKKAAAPKKEPKATVVIEFAGKQVVAKDVLAQATKAFAKSNKGVEIKTVEIYIKPEENTAYYVINGIGLPEYKVEL